MILLNSLARILTAYVVLVLVIACSDDQRTIESTENGSLGIAVPRTITENRMVDILAVSPKVRLSDGTEIPMIPDADVTGKWNSDSGSPVLVEEGSTQSLIVEWFEEFQGQELPLVRQTSEEFTVRADELYAIVLDFNQYIEFDADGDGVFNLTERQENTNPFDRTSGVNVVIPRISSDEAPQIDGGFINYAANELLLVGEWSVAAQRDRANNPLAIDNVLEDVSGAASVAHYHHWAAAHDGTYLYILVISDDDGLHISDSPLDIFEDDDVEIFIDGDNSKLDSYDGVNDFQIHIALLENTLDSGNNSASSFARVQAGINSQPLPQDLEFAVGLGRGPRSPRAGVDRQDIYEIRIRLDEVGIERGQPFGFEIEINDDDDGMARETKWGWFHPEGSDVAWQRPALFGTAILGE